MVPTPRLRVFLSICAAATGSIVCQVQHHFTLSLANPRGFTAMLHHRCGRVFFVAILWMTFETIAAIAFRATEAAPEPPRLQAE